MNIHNIEVGQKLYAEAYTKHDGSLETKEFIVSDVGEHFFETTEGRGRKFDLRTLKYDASPFVKGMYKHMNIQLYLTEKEILDEYEYKVLYNKIFRRIDWRTKPTLEQLKSIEKILENDTYQRTEKTENS